MRKIFLVILSFFAFGMTGLANTEPSVKYYKTVYSEDGLTHFTYEIDEEEYENQSHISLQSTSIITEYKKLYITDLGTSIKLDLECKNMPKYKSFDVIALRGEGVSFETNSLIGIQYFKIDGSSSTIRYDRSSSNTRIFQNGIGISMNLVDDADFYHLSIQMNYYKTKDTAKIYGSYQHSQSNVTLAQSQKYTLSANGYGNVIAFDDSVKRNYDGMSGVYLSV